MAVTGLTPPWVVLRQAFRTVAASSYHKTLITNRSVSASFPFRHSGFVFDFRFTIVHEKLQFGSCLITLLEFRGYGLKVISDSAYP